MTLYAKKLTAASSEATRKVMQANKRSDIKPKLLVSARRALEEAGWTIHVIWECQTKKKTASATFAELLPILATELGKELKI